MQFQGEFPPSAPEASCTMTDTFLLTRDAEAKTPEPIEKTEKEIQEEIQAIFRQITASVTFLPVLDGDCTFNVLVYAGEHGVLHVVGLKVGNRTLERAFWSTCLIKGSALEAQANTRKRTP